jgi:transcriptional regulator with XRE-family HTH domain
VPSLLGEKIRALRKQKKMSLERLGELTETSKSYLWQLEMQDDPKPSADKITRIAAALDVTPDFLLTAANAAPNDAVADQAFFRKYQGMSEQDKRRLRQILDAWERDP